MKKIVLLLILVVTSTLGFSQTSEEKAIIQLLEKESATWRSGDIEAHADCWAIKPYSRILISTLDGQVIDVPPEFMINPAPGSAGNGGTSRNSDYRIGITGNSAIVSHNEVSIAKDGTKTYSYEIRMLEKIDGEWKLIGQSIHQYNPEKTGS